MKNTLYFLQRLLLVCFLSIIFSQISRSQYEEAKDVSGRTSRKIRINFDAELISGDGGLPLGAKVRSIELKSSAGGRRGSSLLYNDSSSVDLSMESIKHLNLKIKNLDTFWKLQAIKNDVYENLINDGFEYGMRKELESDALEYLSNLTKENLIFNDDYLENYLYTLLYKIFPTQLNDGRLGVLNIKIVKDPTPNAGVFPNGTMLINTGLLTTMSSETELIAVMAHEVSHFALDHQIVNIHKAKEREQSTTFWSTLGTVLGAVTDVYLASKNKYYKPGALTTSMAAVSYTIASSINKRLGLEFSRQQESDADKCAVELLEFLHLNPSALSTVLSKIKGYCVQTGDYLSLSDEGSHPALDDRINKIGQPQEFKDALYDTRISLVTTYNAIKEFENRHFQNCSDLVQRNIKSSIATEDDLILKAMTSLFMYDTRESNMNALTFLVKAESLNVLANPILYKQKGLAYLRLDKKPEAKKALEDYLLKLSKQYDDLVMIKNERKWLEDRNYLAEEVEWTKKMIHKIKVL